MYNIYDRIAIDMIEELAEQTVFSKSALEQHDAQELARKSSNPLTRLLSKFQREVASPTNGCDLPKLGNSLTESTAHK
jgi:hypothetical protein